MPWGPVIILLCPHASCEVRKKKTYGAFKIQSSHYSSRVLKLNAINMQMLLLNSSPHKVEAVENFKICLLSLMG